MTLVYEPGKIFVDVTAVLPVQNHDLIKERAAGVDLGVIHPFAAMCESEAFLASGRQLRAEERLHLEDNKQRQRKMSSKRHGRGVVGSRRYKRLRHAKQRAEARHKRKIRQAHHEVAGELIDWSIRNRVGKLVVGDPAGITEKVVGRRHNLRLRQWRRTHLVKCLKDKAELNGIEVEMVNERGTSSTCPSCHEKVSKPRSRNFSCSCGFTGHRDLVGAQNIAARGGGGSSGFKPLVITHRRAGNPPARRDRRRHLYDARRSRPAPGRPGSHPGSRSPKGKPKGRGPQRFVG
ncbi:MAG: RNA-guided endonuclease InsQ/TnpB family protein [Actinomycetota bacterium]